MEGADRAHESRPNDMSIEQVHAAWLAATTNGDVEIMRSLRRQHPQWLNLQRRTPECATTDSGSVRQRFCSYGAFRLSTIGASALHTAAWEGSHDIVELLLEEGQDPDTSDDAGLTPIMVSVLRYNVVVMRCVFRNGEAVPRNIVVDCRKEESRLLKKVMAVVELLLRFNANVDTCSQEGSSALHYVANSDALEVAKMLLDAGANIDAQDQNGRTPLHQSIQEGSLLVTNLLVSRGAQIDLQDVHGVTPLTLTLQQRSVNMLQIILNHHYMVVTSERRDFAADVLFQAVENESEEAVQLILDGDYASVTVRNAAGETPLHRAIMKRNPQLIELLADLDPAGDRLTIQTPAGDTPTHYAARYGSVPVIEKLLQCLSIVFGDLQVLDESTNPLNTTNKDGATCLYVVGTTRSSSGTWDERDTIVELLLRQGARLLPRDDVVARSGSAEQVALHAQVRRGLALWIQEARYHDRGMQDADADAAGIDEMLLTELCIEWVTSVDSLAFMSRLGGADSSSVGAVLLIVVAEGYARELVPLLSELPLLLTAMPTLLRRLGQFSREPRDHPLLLQLHGEVVEALSEATDS